MKAGPTRRGWFIDDVGCYRLNIGGRLIQQFPVPSPRLEAGSLEGPHAQCRPHGPEHLRIPDRLAGMTRAPSRAGAARRGPSAQSRAAGGVFNGRTDQIRLSQTPGRPICIGRHRRPRSDASVGPTGHRRDRKALPAWGATDPGGSTSSRPASPRERRAPTIGTLLRTRGPQARPTFFQAES